MKSKQIFHHFLTAIFALSLVACAGAKVKNERVMLQKGAFSKADVLLVKDVSADNAVFSGDKAGDTQRVNEEKHTVKSQFANQLIVWLKKKGFNAKPYAKGGSGKILEGVVTKFDHGSAAGRAFIGMGAGSSNMVIAFKLMSEKNAPLADFDVVATSGGRGGVFSMGSFMEAHLSDGAEQTAEYLSKKAN